MSEPLERVRAIVAAARRIADPGDPLGREARSRLPASSGLSAAGVELALRHHLEVEPDDGQLASLIATQEAAPRCHVLLSANVCTAALRALACAAASADEVFVRASRRDPVVAELLVNALARSEALSISMVDDLPARPGDELHAYGSDEALAAIAASVPAGVTMRGHGTGIGIAVVERDVDIASAAESLADDLVPFDGRGCLSPRFALVDNRDTERPALLMHALHDTLDERGAAIPRGPLDDGARAELSRYRRLMETVGEFLDGPHHAIAFDPAPTALALPPAARSLLVVGCSDRQLAELLEPWRRYLTAIGRAGGGELAPALHRLAPAARRSALGQMQRPPLDGPVDRRQLEKMSGP